MRWGILSFSKKNAKKLHLENYAFKITPSFENLRVIFFSDLLTLMVSSVILIPGG